MSGAAPIALALAASFALASAAAVQTVKSPFNNSAVNALTVALGCHIENVKVIVITNTTQGTINAGTAINYDAVRYRSTLHYGGSVLSPALAPGASFKIGGSDSSSCTASFRRQAVLSQ
jgi:hypothetical protein